MANKYNGEGYYSPTEFEAFTRMEKEEKAARKAAAFRPIVYICSPYSGDTEKNIENARKYSRFAVDCHYLPITPHIYFTQFLDDSNEAERECGLGLGIHALKQCDEFLLIVIDGKVSEGMQNEIEVVSRLGIHGRIVCLTRREVIERIKNTV